MSSRSNLFLLSMYPFDEGIFTALSLSISNETMRYILAGSVDLGDEDGESLCGFAEFREMISVSEARRRLGDNPELQIICVTRWDAPLIGWIKKKASSYLEFGHCPYVRANDK
jgi:hypothetical protein